MPMTFQELKDYFTKAQSSGIGPSGGQGADALGTGVDLAGFGLILPGLFGGDAPAPHPFASGTGLSRFSDPNNILKQGPHQGRGAFNEILTSYGPDLQAVGPQGQEIVALAQRFMAEQDSRAIQDEGSTSYGQVANATEIANRIAQLIRELLPDKLQTIEQLQALPPAERTSYRVGLLASGQTQDDLDRAKLQGQFLVERLIQNGLDADDAVKLQQTLLQSRGDQLSEITKAFKVLTEATASKLISADQVRDIGARYAQEVDNLVQEGRDITTEFAPRLRAISDQVQAQIPGIQQFVDTIEAEGKQLDELGKQVQSEIPGIRQFSDSIEAEGKQLGEFDETRFNRRFQPVLERLKNEYNLRRQAIKEDLNARGISPGSEQEAYQSMLLEREFAEQANRAALEAQASSEGQELSEYGARGTVGLQAKLSPFEALIAAKEQELAAYGAKGTVGLQAKLTPFEALRAAGDTVTSEGESRLRMHAARGDDINALANKYTGVKDELTTKHNIEATGVEAAGSEYDRRKAEMDQANQRFGTTYGVATAQTSVPQSERLQIAAGASQQNLGTRLGYEAKAEDTRTARTLASRQLPFNIVGAGLGALGTGVGSYLASSKESKENITELDEGNKDQGFLKLLNQINLKGWNYKGDPTPHVGGIAEEMPDGITTPDKKSVDVINTLSTLIGAVQELDKRTRKPGGGFAALKEVIA